MIDQVELVPLGTCAANMNSHQKYSAYLLNFYQLVENSKERKLINQILLDAGNNRIIDERWVNPEHLSAVFITHSHMDHTYSIGKLSNYLKKHKRTNPLPIYFPIHAEKKIHFSIRISNRWNQNPW